MSDADHDPLLRRAIDELRRVPAADPQAIRRVVEAAALARVTPADEPGIAPQLTRGRSVRLWSAVSVAAAAAIVGFVARGAWMPSAQRATTVAAAAPTVAAMSESLHPAGFTGAPIAIPQQFVLENRQAQHISVVGDFNQWDPSRTPMTRTADGLWSAMIPLSPGRHVYGYMVDSVFTLDPRVPSVRDPDLGSNGSVIIVGRP